MACSKAGCAIGWARSVLGGRASQTGPERRDRNRVRLCAHGNCERSQEFRKKARTFATRFINKRIPDVFRSVNDHQYIGIAFDRADCGEIFNCFTSHAVQWRCTEALVQKHFHVSEVPSVFATYANAQFAVSRDRIRARRGCSSCACLLPAERSDASAPLAFRASMEQAARVLSWPTCRVRFGQGRVLHGDRSESKAAPRYVRITRVLVAHNVGGGRHPRRSSHDEWPQVAVCASLCADVCKQARGEMSTCGSQREALAARVERRSAEGRCGVGRWWWWGGGETGPDSGTPRRCVGVLWEFLHVYQDTRTVYIITFHPLRLALPQSGGRGPRCATARA